MSAEEKASASSFGARLLGAASLQAATLREVASRGGALPQAALVVGVAGAARGIAAFGVEGWLGLVGSVVAGFVFWVVVALVVQGAGGLVLGTRPARAALAGALGFAAAPLWALCVVPLLPMALGNAVFWISHFAAASAAVVAVREACDTTLGRALLICASALLVGFLVLFAIGLLFVGRETYAIA